ncbi:ABC transporter substrate-binding protein [Acuticoccus yangtzensis]|uniref:ABC transporter substrate-binding protein n=1 Tax=Acuticoccus yangtzensis TaxID=1443441 RepID=UPI0009495377
MTRTNLTALALPAAMSAALATAVCGPATAQDTMAVTFGTNWLPQAEHGGYYQALADGTYAACGLDVTIAPGGPQVNNRALLLAGRIQFHMGGNLLQAFNAAQEGIPLKVVAAHFQKEPQIIMTHPGEGFDTWESLTGLPTLFLGENGYQSFYQWMIDAYGFKAEQRKPYTFNPAPFVADKKSGQQGYVTSEPFAVETVGGFKPNVFLLADYGFDTYATTVEVMDDFITDNADAVQCFVDASAIGWTKYLYGDASAGDKAILDANADMSQEQLDYSRNAMKEYGIVDSGESLTDGIGAMTAARIEGFYEKMVAAGVAPDNIELSDMYTLDFVNKGVGLDIKTELTK